MLLTALALGAALLLGIAALPALAGLLSRAAPAAPRLAGAAAGHLVVLTVFPYLVLLLALIETIRPVRARVLRFLGDCSYSIYLLHFPLQLFTVICLDAARFAGERRVRVFVALAAIGVALSFLHWPIGRGMVSFFFRSPPACCCWSPHSARSAWRGAYPFCPWRDSACSSSRPRGRWIRGKRSSAPYGFLATKVAFINEMADICEKAGADVQDVVRGMGLDNRIGSKFLHAGPGFGGSCFPKDTLALAQKARELGSSTTIIEAVAEANRARKNRMTQKVIAACGDSVADKTVAILGLAFKQNTDDIREAAAIDIIIALQSAGAKVRAYDPQAMDQARQILTEVTFCQNAYLCAEGASALVIVTEWDAFRALDLTRIKDALSEPIIVDLRNIYSPSDMRKRGFRCFSVGRQ